MKRLICCLDGTWDEPTDTATLTNVVKLYNAIPAVDAAGVAQLRHYEIGIGTNSMGLRSFVSGALGLEVGDRIRSAYRFLVANYQPGDEIHAFGFSRGAFEARSLGGLIALAGFVGSDALVDQAWRLYSSTPSVWRTARLKELRRQAHYPVRIRCIGVWDTVGNLGIPGVDGRFNRRFRFHDTSLSPLLDVGLHALAIDEPRGTFSPTLWTLKKGAQLQPGQAIEQVWFAGSHANVGGGLAIEGSGLSDIALLWMAERAHTLAGIGCDFDKLRAAARPDPLAEQYSPSAAKLFRWSGVVPFIRLIKQNTRALPWQRRLLGGWRSSKVAMGRVSINEQLHESVLERFGKAIVVRSSDGVTPSTYSPRTVAVLQAAAAPTNRTAR